MYEYRAAIIRVVDGDSLHAEVDLGFDVRMRMKLRLAGVNAPEMNTLEGKTARGYLIELFGTLPAAVTLRTEKDRQEKYGRYLAWIHLPDGRSVNELLLATGHAIPYP